MEVLKRVDNIMYIALNTNKHPVDEIKDLLNHFNLEYTQDVVNNTVFDLVEYNNIFYQLDKTNNTAIYKCNTDKLLQLLKNNTNKKKV
jgi:hypothetical protein